MATAAEYNGISPAKEREVKHIAPSLVGRGGSKGQAEPRRAMPPHNLFLTHAHNEHRVMFCRRMLVYGAFLSSFAVLAAATKPPADEQSPPAAQPVKKETNGKKKPEPADNFYCLVCHANYEDEKIARTHQKQGIGCAKCHGASEAHSGDEDNITPPEIMFPKDAINASCMTCHEREKLAKEEEHEELLAAGEKAKQVCTDCHGKHRLKVRTRVWDKRTGKLIHDDGVRMESPVKEAKEAK
jgi:hypothetical protein